MRTFRHRATRMVVGANLKVMFTFLTRHPAFAAEQVGWCDVLLWRDPLDRIVSMFFDKCRANLDPGNVQGVQKLIMDRLGVEDVRRLADVEFSELVPCLEAIMMRDWHLTPQVSGVRLKDIGRVVDIATGLPGLGKELGVDFSRRENPGSHRPALEYYTPATRETIERLYAMDFAARGHRSLELRLKRLAGWFR